MKKYLLLLAIIFASSILVYAQKTIVEKVEVSNQKAELKLSFADNIKIESWGKEHIEVKATVNIDNNKYNDRYKLEVDKNGSLINVIEEIDFDAIKKAKEKSGEGNPNNWNTEINYTVNIPENLDYNLKTISGEIEIVGGTGEMNIKTVSGYIDYSVPSSQQASINLSTVTGDVYSNLKFDAKPNHKIDWVGTKEKLDLNGGGNLVSLKSVSGDIYLRKKL